jgi:integrase
VPLDALCRRILSENRDHDTILFVERYGGPNTLNRLCERLASLAGLEPFGPHALRHFFVTRMFRAGKPAKIISKIVGHSTLAITEQIYCHLLPEDLIGQTEGFET